MNNSAWLTPTFCRKCKKLRSCLETKTVSNYRYMCKECSRHEGLVEACIGCGREGIKVELEKHGGFCHLCESDNIVECKLCGKETYTSKTPFENTCKECTFGINQPCSKCGSYHPKKELSKDGLCDKCNIKVFKKKFKENADEVFECIECGREQYIGNMENGLCMFCYKEEQINQLKKDMKYLKRKVYSSR